MDEGNVLNDVLQRTLDFLDRGFGLIEGEVYWLFGTLLVINLTLAGLTWAVSRDEIMAALARRILYIGFFAWLVLNWPTLIDTLGEGFVKVGFTAGNNPGLAHDFYNPGKVLATGWAGSFTILEAANELTGIRATFVNLPQIVVLLISALVYFTAFALIAFQVFLGLIQFKIGTLAAFFLLPMALLNKTSFLAERPISWLFASGVRLMVLALVMALGVDLIASLTVSEDLTLRQAVAAAIGAVSLFLLARMAASIASDLVQGSPNLGMDTGFPAIGALGVLGVAGGGVVATRSAGMAIRSAGAATRFAATKAASVVPGGTTATRVIGSAINTAMGQRR